MKGTQLQQLEEEYELVHLNIGITESALRRKSTDMPALKDDLERAVQAHAQAVRAQEQRATEKTLMTELAWAYVAEQEQVRALQWMMMWTKFDTSRVGVAGQT